MRIVQFIGLILVGVQCQSYYTFSLNSTQVENLTLEFKANVAAYQTGVKCDAFQSSSDYWYSTSYGNSVVVTSQNRQQYKCSNSNFTISMSSEFNQAYVTFYIYDYNTSQLIATYNFLHDDTYIYRSQQKEDTASINYLYTYKDYYFDVEYPSTVYVEIFRCPDRTNFDIRQYNKYQQFRLVSNSSDKYLYDVINTTVKDQIGYRMDRTYTSNLPDFYFKYQRGQQQELQNINSYRGTYYLSYSVVNDRVVLWIPQIKTLNNEKVQFSVVISYKSWLSESGLCVFGDQQLYSHYIGYSYSGSIYALVTQTSNNGYQQEILLMPENYRGNYVIMVTAKVLHGTITQTIPYEISEFHYDGYSSQSIWVYILTPVFIFSLAIISFIFAYCRYRYKQKKQEQKEIQDIFMQNQNNQQQYVQYQGIQ